MQSAQKAPKTLGRTGKNKGQMAKELVTFQIGLPDCSRGYWCWAGKGKLQPYEHSWDSSVDGEGGDIVM